MQRQRATIRCFALGLALLAMLAPVNVLAQEETRVVNREHYLKAAFLYHFTSFITWPEEDLAEETIDIGILGNDPFGKALETIAGKVAKGRKIVVKRANNLADLESCVILFIDRSEQERLPQILAQLNGRSVLTVSNIKDFAKHWGAINFTTAQNRVRFEINPAAIKRANLRVSSRLLRVALLVNDGHVAPLANRQ